MTPGQDFILYGGKTFLAVVEARWAVFFDALNHPYYYDPEAEWGLPNAQHYRPQFSLPRLNGYLEVQRFDDHRTRQPLQHYYPEIEEHAAYLAVGDLPDEQQLGAIGWWDPGRSQGVMKLTPCFDWGEWFPPNYPDVLEALEVARTEEFTTGIPSLRQPEEEVRDIPEREREQPPQ